MAAQEGALGGAGKLLFVRGTSAESESREYDSERELEAWISETGQEPTKADLVRINMPDRSNPKHDKVGHISGPMKDGRKGYPITTSDGEVYHAKSRNVMISPVKKSRGMMAAANLAAPSPAAAATPAPRQPPLLAPVAATPAAAATQPPPARRIAPGILPRHSLCIMTWNCAHLMVFDESKPPKESLMVAIRSLASEAVARNVDVVLLQEVGKRQAGRVERLRRVLNAAIRVSFGGGEWDEEDGGDGEGGETSPRYFTGPCHFSDEHQHSRDVHALLTRQHVRVERTFTILELNPDQSAPVGFKFAYPPLLAILIDSRFHDPSLRRFGIVSLHTPAADPDDVRQELNLLLRHLPRYARGLKGLTGRHAIPSTMPMIVCGDMNLNFSDDTDISARKKRN